MCKNTSLNIGKDIQVVPKKMRCNSVRNLMCVGRYAEKDVMERSEMESFRTFSSLELVRANACNRYVSIMHSSGMRHHQNLLMAKSHPAGMRVCYAIFAGISLRLCSISHNLRCIPAYTHQIPTGFFSIITK